MVKIPGLDDLKKIGSDLMDSAKTVNLSGVVDKLKTGIESVSKKSNAELLSGDDPLGKLLQDTNVTLNELAMTTKKLQNQLTEIARVAALYQKPEIPAAPPTAPEDDQK